MCSPVCVNPVLTFFVFHPNETVPCVVNWQGMVVEAQGHKNDKVLFPASYIFLYYYLLNGNQYSSDRSDHA
jgi:hypothetical protein